MIPSSQRSATYRERQRAKMQRMEDALRTVSIYLRWAVQNDMSVERLIAIADFSREAVDVGLD